jgi:hypothetical protein
VWVMCHVQFVLFTTKSTKDTKGSKNFYSELRALRVLRGENIFAVNPEEPCFCARQLLAD